MKKSLFIFSFLLAFTFVEAQTSKSLDTIYANSQKNVALFFPKPIRQGITGSANFVFTYNREKSQYFGLLQASPGEESNLLAVTNDGQVYSYILKYKSGLSKLNYFIVQKESIGNEKPLVKVDVESLNEVQPKHASNFLEAYRLEYFKKYAEFILKRPGILSKSKRKNGMIVRVRKLVYNRSEVYVHMEIENRSGIDFEIDALNIYKINGNKRRKSSYQKLQQEIIYKHKIPEAIKNKQSVSFIYVMPKLVLGNNQKLQVELLEMKGDRNIIVKM